MSSFDQIRAGKDGCLIQAALEFAIDEYPHLDVNNYLRTIHHFARDFERFRGYESQPENVLRLLTDYFFGELEFTGNTENYYDPRNSYLNDVIDRRMGIPISLSVVFQHLASAAGIRLVGINFPGHFLLAYQRRAIASTSTFFNVAVGSIGTIASRGSSRPRGNQSRW